MNIEKNILDLEYQRYLQYHAATLIILATYLIAVGVSLITNKLTFGFSQIIMLVVPTSFMVILSTIFFILINKKKQEIKVKRRSLA